MTCIIVDDNQLSRKDIEQLVNCFSTLKLSGIFNNQAARLYLQNRSIDTQFIDLEKSEIKDFGLTRKPEAATNYNLDAFEIDASDSLVDQIGTRLKGKIESRNTGNRIFIKERNRVLNIPVSDIEYIETHRNHSSIYTSKGNYTMHNTLSNDTKLPPELTHIQKSHVVYLNKIDAIDEMLILIGKRIIPAENFSRKEFILRICFQ